MTIKKKELAKQIRKEYKEAREWLRRDWRHTYRMMIDADDGEIWADCFLDVNNGRMVSGSRYTDSHRGGT